MRTAIILCACAATGCLATTHYGTAQPSRDICNLGAFDQELAVAPDFRVVRVGDDAFVSDAEVKRGIAADAQEVKRTGVCPGSRQLGTFRMTLHRIEVGSSRGYVMKGLMWSLFLLPTLGISSAYPASETRWLTLELDAVAIVDGKSVWTGEFTSHTEVRSLAKELPTPGSELTNLMKRAQTSAASELLAASRSK
jgi:hypothetical protein